MPGLWLEEALAGATTADPLEGEEAADVCIVGGGYTGLWTALRIKEIQPAAHVVLVEERYCGYGASGRNQGQLLDWWVKFPSFEALLGAEEALRLARMAEATIAEIERFCAEHAIDADFQRAGWLWGATSTAQLGAWESTIAAHAVHGVEVLRRVDRDEAVQLGGSPRLLGAAFQAGVAVVQPAKLVRGLRRVALERGVRLYERTPMIRLERGWQPCVVTPQGSVRTGSVVLALNSWLTRFRELRKALFVLGSDIVATEPIPQRLTEIGFDRGVPVTDSRTLLKYVRTTPDGRVVNGLGGTALVGPCGNAELFAGLPTAGRIARLEQSLGFLFPQLQDVPVTHSWTGPVDRSWTGLPFFGALPGTENVFLAAGYSGNGVGPAHVAGRVLASLALERDDEWSSIARLLPVRGGLPPEPLRTLGGRLVRGAVARRERFEDKGRRPDPVTTALSAFAPSGVVPKRGRSGGG